MGNMTLTDIRTELENKVLPFIAEKKSGKVTLEINISQGGIGQTYIDTREAVGLKR